MDNEKDLRYKGRGLSKTAFTHSDLLRWQNKYVGRSLKMNGLVYRDTYKRNMLIVASIAQR